jgi:hypothetical protein
MQRFEILRSFIHDRIGEKPEENRALQTGEPTVSCDGKRIDAQLRKMEERLTLDFYLRENGKSRPAWAEDLGGYREVVAAFYQSEEKQGRYLPNHDGMTWKQMMRMTHLEHFTSDVLDMGDRQAYWVLFDYTRRDPLTGDAMTQIVDLEKAAND